MERTWGKQNAPLESEKIKFWPITPRCENTRQTKIFILNKVFKKASTTQNN